MKDALFYGVEGQERLNSCPDSTIEQYLGGLADYSELEFPIKVLEYKQEKLWAEQNLKKYAESILDDILEGLDDEYGDPDDFGTTPSENMKKDALKLAHTIVNDYHVWRCRETGNVIEYNEKDIDELK